MPVVTVSRSWGSHTQKTAVVVANMQDADTGRSTRLACHPTEVHTAALLRQHRHLPRGEAHLVRRRGVNDVGAVRAAEILLGWEGKSTGDSNQAPT